MDRELAELSSDRKLANMPASLDTPCEQTRPRKVRYGYEKLAVVGYAMAREILRCAQDDTKKASSARVILSESFCSEESRRTLRRPVLVAQSSPSGLQQDFHHVVGAGAEDFVALGCVVQRHHVAYQRARVDRAAFHQAHEFWYVRVDVGKPDAKREIAHERMADWKIERRHAEHADYRYCATAARRHYGGRQRALVADRLDSHVGAAFFSTLENFLI